MATTELRISPEDVKQASSQVKEHIPEPTVVVIFGASGDLTKRKLLPALFHLEESGLLPKEFRIVGVARRDLGKGFADDMKQGIIEFGGVKAGADKLDDFTSKIGYHAMEFDNDDGYRIIFDEEVRKFGLACGTRRDPVFIGWHGSFLNTVQGM